MVSAEDDHLIEELSTERADHPPRQGLGGSEGTAASSFRWSIRAGSDPESGRDERARPGRSYPPMTASSGRYGILG